MKLKKKKRKVMRIMEQKQIKVALYIRTNKASSEEVKKQENKLLQVCDINDYLIYDFYIDNGYSGTSNNRIEYKRMLEDMKAKKFDLILTCSFDRLTRSIKELDKFLTLTEKYDCDCKTIYDNINLKSSVGKLFIGLTNFYSNFEMVGVENE